jgi:hypothetical protein
MIAWILGLALIGSLLFNWLYWYLYDCADDLRVEANDYCRKLVIVNADLRDELKRTGAHRDELQARYQDQEAERIASTEKAAKRSERARKASQARWGKKEVA